LREIFRGHEQSYVPWSAPRWSSAEGFSHRLHSCQIAEQERLKKYNPAQYMYQDKSLLEAQRIGLKYFSDPKIYMCTLEQLEMA
jgi:hypothetical protein